MSLASTRVSPNVKGAWSLISATTIRADLIIAST
jgi:hypothetical protein